MKDLTPKQRRDLLYAIADRQGNAREISQRFDRPIAWLRSFVEENEQELANLREELERTEPSEVTPAELGQLWIANKVERLRRYQDVTDLLYREVMKDPTDSTTLRELRSYMAAVGNELGQLMHRGSGEAGMGDTVSYEIPGVNLENLR